MEMYIYLNHKKVFYIIVNILFVYIQI